MNVVRTLTYGAVATGCALGAGVAAVAASGRSAGRRHDSRLDELQHPPEIARDCRVEAADGGSVYVAEFGDITAPPVVLLHGVTLQWQFWSAVIRLLEPSHRVIAVETRGHGRSVPGSSGVTLAAAADDLVSVLDELNCGPAVVVGHSMGGMILGTCVATHPDRVDDLIAGMVFVSTMAGPPRSSPPALAFTRVQAPAAALLSSLVNGPLPTPTWGDNDVARGLVGTAFGPAATATMTEDLRRMQAEMDPSVTADSLVSIAEYEVHDDLAALGSRRRDLPVGVVVGDVDRLTPPVCAREIAACFSSPVFRHLPEIGHQLPQEAPFELAAAISTVAARAAAGAVEEESETAAAS